jgi:hypothetical protein
MALVTLVLGVDPPSEILTTLAPAAKAEVMPRAIALSEKLQPSVVAQLPTESARMAAMVALKAMPITPTPLRAPAATSAAIVP